MSTQAIRIALVVVGMTAAVAAFLVPVSAEGYGSCGMAGTWFPYLGDPTGPGEPAEVYGEYVACGRASLPWHAGMVVGLVLALAGTVGLLRTCDRQGH